MFEKNAGSLLEFAHSYNKFGLNINQDGDLEYREWAPNAKEVSLVCIQCFYLFLFSLETSMIGIVILTSVKKMTSECGPLSCLKMPPMPHYLLNIFRNSSAA